MQGGEQAGPAPPSQAQLAQAQRNKEENEDTTLDDSKFDEFMGNDAGALATTGEYDQDDQDADDVWAQIDSHMDNRRWELSIFVAPVLKCVGEDFVVTHKCQKAPSYHLKALGAY